MREERFDISFQPCTTKNLNKSHVCLKRKEDSKILNGFKNFYDLTCVTPTLTSRLTPELPLMISPVPFRNPTPPRRKPDINTPNASSKDIGLRFFTALSTKI